jgi:type II secretory pathway component GspD/PulD (secretin)
LHGLLKPSFVPPPPQRALRDLTRYRGKLIDERSRTVNRVQKLLEGANIKLASVVSDIQGVSAQAMLREIVAGQTDAEALAQLARGRLRTKLPELEKALTGLVQPHHRYLLAMQLSHIDFLDEQVFHISAEIARQADLARSTVSEIVGTLVATGLIAEIGPGPSNGGRRPIVLGPFTITPFLVDHSAYDAYAILVEADAGTNSVLLRAPEADQKMLEDMIAKLDEGTQQAARETRIFELKHVSAANLATMAPAPALIAAARTWRSSGSGSERLGTMDS